MTTHHEPEFQRPELAALLAAAAAPGDERELAGETAAVWQFRTTHVAASARAGAARHRRTRTVFKAALANALAAKVALAGAAAVAAGGVVLAAETGGWPSSPVYLVAPPAVSAPAHRPSHDPEPTDANVAPSDSPETDTPPSEPSESNRPTDSGSGTADATPTPSLTGLCKAYQAGATSNPGKALANPAFSVLVSTAGGADNVATYCTALVGPPALRPTNARPTHPGHARGHSKAAPGSRGHGHGRSHSAVRAHGKTRPLPRHGRWSNQARGTPMRT